MAIAALLLLILGLALIVLGKAGRRRAGLIDARTLDLDGRNLYSEEHRLVARPDRVVREDGLPIPVEQKSARRVYPNHRAQIGVQFIVIEAAYGKRPTHGYIETGDGSQHRIENTPELKAWVLRKADELRAAKRALRGG